MQHCNTAAGRSNDFVVHLQRYQYAEVVETIRAQVSEFRSTLKSPEMRIPKGFPIKKIAISRIHAPNGVSTIRIEFACPSFVDQEAVLGRFLLHLHSRLTPATRQSVEVMPVPQETDQTGKKSAFESYEQPAVQFLYSDGNGSFQFVRDSSSLAPKSGGKFIFYKDEFLTENEIDAIVGAYKEIYAYPNVNAFFRQEMEQSRRKNISIARGGNQASTSSNGPSDTKV